MIILDCSKKNHDQIIQAVALALKHGKVVAYPTDTSYGLAVDTKNEKAVKKFYKIKERTTKKPVHIVVSSIAEAKKYAVWSKLASKLAKQFWPGKVTLVLPLKFQSKILKQFSAGTNTIGLRIPDNQIAIDIVKKLGRPITATSANPSAHLSGGVDSYSAEEVIQQFFKQKFQPDIVINAGKLRKTKPSTMVKINLDGSLEILRVGPVSKALILKVSKY